MNYSFKTNKYKHGGFYIAVTVIYVILFMAAYNFTGNAATALSLIPVAVIGAMYGIKSGIISGILIFPLNILLLNLYGQPGLRLMSGNGLIGSMIVIALGAAAGKIREYHDKLEEMNLEQIKRDGILLEDDKNINGILKIADDCLIYLDKSEKIIDINIRAAQVLDMRKDKLIGKYFTELPLFSPEDRSRVISSISKAFTGESPSISFKVENIEKDKFLECTFALMEKDDKAAGVLIIARDITDRKVKEGVIKEKNEMYQALIETSPDSITLLDIHGNFIMVNPKTVEMHGYRKEEDMLGTSAIELVVPEEREKAVNKLKEITKKGKKITGEFNVLKKDGSTFTVEVNVSSLRNMKGDPEAIISISRDVTERKKAENLLRKSEELYRTLIETCADSITLSSMDGEMLMANRAAVEMRGYKNESELLKKNMIDLIAPYEIAKAKNGIENTLKNGKVDHIEYSLLKKDGMEFPADVSVSLIKDEKSAPNAFMAVVRDITERKEAEEILRDSEEKHRMIFENASDIIVYVDRKGKIRNVNKKIEEVLGYKKEEVIGKRFDRLKIYKYGYLTMLKKLFEQVTKTLKLTDLLEVELIHRNGSEVVLEVSTKIIRRKDEIKGFLCIIRDVTERKAIEKAIQESKEMYEGLVKTSPDAVTVTDMRGKITWVSQRTLEIHGFKSSEEVIGKSAFEFIAPEDHELAARNMEITLREGVIRNCEYNMLKKDGSKFYGALNAALIKDNQNNPVAFMATTRDISERKKMEKELMNSLREKSVLYREMYHRVKNNMQMMSSILRLQSRQIKNKELKELLRESQNRIMAMSLVHDKLYDSKDYASVNINKLIKTVANELLKFYSMDPDRISIKVDAPDIFLGVDYANPCGIIINELVSNSIKYAFPENGKGEIFISFHVKNKENELIVKDNGIGIPGNVDLENTDTLGLRLMNILVKEKLCGKIKLNRDKGTEFKIKFKEK
ncbi:PAS domain S-box protein [Elusimicrobiota bacterium]